MRRWLIPLFIVLSIPAAAQQRTIYLRAAGPDRFDATPRQIINIVFICGNSGNEKAPVVLEASLPEGWKRLGGGYGFDIPPGGTDIQVFSFLVPEKARAQEYPIRCLLRGVGDGGESEECAISITVLPEVSVRLEVLEQPPFVLAGDDYSVSFLITNAGNADVGVDLSVQDGSSFPFETSGVSSLADLPLLVGTNVVLDVLVHTPKGLVQSAKNPLKVTVLAHGREKEGPLAVATSIVEAIPVTYGAGTLYNTIPLKEETMGSMAFTTNVDAALQETVRAAGAIDESGENRIDLLLKKRIDTEADLLLNPADQYGFRYSNPFLDILLGDQYYGLSPLTVSDKFARGAQAVAALGPLHASAFAYDDFRSTTPECGLGGSLGLTIPAWGGRNDTFYSAGLGVFSPLTDRILADLLQRFAPIGDITLLLDTALDIDANTQLNPAVLASAQGDHGFLSWNAQFIRAWPGFSGAYHDTQTIQGGIGVRFLDDNLKLQGAVGFTNNNLLLDPSQESAEQSLHVTAGASGTVPDWGTRGMLQWDTIWRRDLLPAPDFDTLENRLGISLRQPFGDLKAGESSTVSATYNELTGTMEWFHKHELSLEYDPLETLGFKGSLAYRERLIGAQTPEHSIGVSLGATFDPPRMHAEVGLRNEWSFASTGLGGVSIGLDGRLSYTFPWEHSISVEGSLSVGWSVSAWTPTGILSLTYGVPINLPISRKRDAISVRGTVVRQETGAPMEGVVLRLNGHASVTNSDGAFEFYLPASGTHYIQIDRRSLETGLIPVETVPYKVESPPGSETRLSLAMVEGGTISGQVVDYGFPLESGAFISGGNTGSTTPQLQRLGGLGGLVVELSDGRDSKRHVTGMDGSFVFEEVRPGSWTLRIVAGQLPIYHSPEQAEWSVTLAPGEKREIELRVVQEQRRMRIVNIPEAVVEPETAPASGQVIRLETPATVPAPAPETPAPEQPPPQSKAPTAEPLAAAVKSSAGAAATATTKVPEVPLEPEPAESPETAEQPLPSEGTPVAASTGAPPPATPMTGAQSPVSTARPATPGVSAPASSSRSFVPGPAPTPNPFPTGNEITIPGPRPTPSP